MAKVSIVIPCYNQGIYIDDAVNSVLLQDFDDYEIIIVNDGSTDEFTINKLQSYSAQSVIKVIHTSNQGLASARNTGIKESTGNFILPLDADDKIGATYLRKSVSILEKDDSIGIVYCEAEFFGDKQGKWLLNEYNFERLLIDNVIFCSAFFRKSSWVQVNGYNPNMKYGLEDWDLWLSITTLDIKVYKIPETLFFYRIKNDSMIKELAQNKKKSFQMYMQAIFNHQKLYLTNCHLLFAGLSNFINEHGNISFISYLYLDRGNGFNDIDCLVKTIEIKGKNDFIIRFPLNDINTIRNIRFHPVKNQFCKCRIDRITADRRINVLQSSNAEKVTNGWHWFYTNYPKFNIKVESGLISWIEISGNIEVLTNTEIADYLKSLKADLSRLKHSKFYRILSLVKGFIKKR